MSTLPLEALKGVINLYDIITYPVYYLTQQPWKKVAKMNAVRAVQEDPSDPYSPWIRVGKAPTCLAEGCETIDELLRKCIKTYYNRNAFGYRKILKEEKVIQNDGRTFYKRALEPKYTWLTYGEIDKRIDDIMRGILINGIKPGDRVVIFMETRMEWMLFAQALYRMGATLATVYATLGDEGVIHVIEEVQSTHLLTSSDLLSKVKSIRHRLSKLKTVIYCEDSIHPEPMTSYGLHEVDLQLVRFDHLEYQGSQADASLKGIPPKGDDIALIMYTSGSTGVPKGVSAYHKNTIAACMSLYTVLSQIDVRDGDYSISYLPLAHNLEFTTEHLNFCLGSGIGFASPLTLTDQSLGLLPGSIGDISILKPGALITVPLILDRIRKAVLEKIEKKGPFARDLFNFCLEYKLNWQKRGFKTPIMDKLVFGKIAGGFGGQIRGIFSGGAPLPASVHSFAASTLNAVMMQGYGLTETTAIGTLMDMDDFSTGKVGAPLFGCKIRLVDWDEGGYRVTDEPRSRGEIVIGGPCLAAGYFNQPEQTAEVFKVEDGYRWFYTGDIGEFYPDGTLKIIDRKKDLVKLQFGEYVSLGKVESELKTCPYVENMCVYGDSYQNHIVALIIPNRVTLKELAKLLSLQDIPFVDLCENKKITQHILEDIQSLGKRLGLHKSEIPAAIKLCSEEWTPASGLVTAALKIRRKQVQQFYQVQIDKMYQQINDVTKSLSKSNGNPSNNNVSNGKLQNNNNNNTSNRSA